MPKSKQYVESSDDSSDSEPKTKTKVSKKAKRDESSEEEVKRTKKGKRDESSEEEPKQAKKAKKETKKDDSEENIWELGNNRRVTVREFKGKLFVDVREMYFDKDGDIKPGKKGICMSIPQWRKFMDVVSDVDEAVKAKC